MDTRRETCQWCGVKLLVPLQAQNVLCPYCQNITDFQHKRNGYYYPQVNDDFQHNRNGYYYPQVNDYPNRVSNNVYNNSLGFPGYNSNRWSPEYAMPTRITSPGDFQSHRMPMQVLPPSVHGRRRAVLCGVSYKGHPKAIKGSVHDVLSMKYLLVQRLGFPMDSVKVLTEEEDQHLIPTKKNIRAALRWLVHGCQSGDSLVFHYSGHGSRVRDRDGDELDGHDETLCPVDFETEGKILDDEINETIVRPLPRGATLHAIIDTCFSGTFLDLPYVCRIDRKGYYWWDDHQIPYAAYKGTNGGSAISISACDDHQKSGSSTIFTGTPTGALTYGFIQILERKEPRLTYGHLLQSVRSIIHKAQKELSNVGTLGPDLVQEPLLSSSEQFDIHSKLFFI